MVRQTVDSSIRHSNKEPEWSSICNNVFDQYLDDDDVFGFEAGGRERSSSDDFGDLFDSSTPSEQSRQTIGTSHIPSWEYRATQNIEIGETKQPKAKEPVDFWTKTVRALEQNAAESERRQQTLRASKSHPEFLSLGGYPSPPAMPSPNNQLYSAQRRRYRGPAANGRNASQARSVSRGRPTRVLKAPSAANPSATIRNTSASPVKMSIPSRYRAGTEDVWVERATRSPKKYEIGVPSHTFPESPLLSAKVFQLDDHFAAFGRSPSGFVPLPAYDEQLSPLTTTFLQAHIHSPIESPAINAVAITRPNTSHFDDVSHAPARLLASQTIPLNDTAPLFPQRTSSLAPHKFEAFDFGFASAADDPFITTPFAEPVGSNSTTDPFPFRDAFTDDTAALGCVQPHDIAPAGLGINCDPALVSSYSASLADASVSPTVCQWNSLPPGPYYLPTKTQNHSSTVPNTPRHPSRHSECPPTPPPGTESRANQRPRRSSRHRRTKSTNSTPRHPQNLEKGGFVNFTPQDSNKILSGVAPSGSSKTKARREKEAADKRRRLSQAAVRAVVEAGGDLESLAKAGLLH